MGGRPPPTPKKLIREFKRKVREPVVSNNLIFFELARNGKSLLVFDKDTFKGKFLLSLVNVVETIPLRINSFYIR